MMRGSRDFRKFSRKNAGFSETAEIGARMNHE
jgi:hypothetical protein